MTPTMTPKGPPLPDMDVARARRTILWDGIFARFMDTMTGGPFLAGLALYAGASTFIVALIAALPFLAQVAQFPTVQFLMRVRDRRRVVVAASTTARSVFVVVAILVFVLEDRIGAWLLFLLLAVTAVVTVVSNASWNWWMRDLMPRAELGRYFGRRLQITASIAALATPLAGLMLDAFAGRGQEYLGYALLFGVGALAGFASTFFLSLTPHRDAALHATRPNALRAVLQPLREAGNQRLAIGLMLVAATLTIMLPFTSIFLLRSLDLSFFGVAILSLASQFAYVGSLRSWGYLSDRFGNRPVMQISVGMMVVSLIGWSFTWGHELALLYILLLLLHFLGGFAVAGIDLTAHNILLKTAPEQGAPAYMAALSMSRALVAGVATLIAGAVWQALGTGELVSWTLIAGFEWTVRGFHVLAVASVVVGIAALLALRRIEEPGRAPILEVARAMRREVRMLSSVAGIRAFVHAVSYVVEFFAQEPLPPTTPAPASPAPTDQPEPAEASEIL